MRKSISRFLQCLLLACLAGCGSSTIEQLEPISEERATIVLRIKAQLIEADDVDAAAIRVNQEDDNVIVLSGFVTSKSEALAAEAIAQDSEPTSTIINRLTVR